MFNVIFKRIKENIYLLIPMMCIVFWALIFLISTIFDPSGSNFIYFDFKIYYESGKQILEDPTKLYTKDYGYDIGYVYLPCFAMFFAVTISLLPYVVGYFTLYVINVISGILMVREFNKILINVDVKERIHRFIFLIIISNGFVLFNIFRQNQLKFIIGFFLFFIIRREIQYRREEIEKDLKFYLLNYGLLVFVVNIAPYFIFILLIYVFQDIDFNDLFKKINLKKYSIVILMFLIQNILFIIYPTLILDFLVGFYKHPLFFFYLVDIYEPSGTPIIILSFISTFLTVIFTIFLILKKDLKIEVKFSYFSIFALFFSLFANRTLLILLPFTLLLFVPFLVQDKKGIEFIKVNFILLIGLLSIALIYFNVNAETIYAVFQTILLGGETILIIIYLRWLILLSIMAISLLILYLKSNEII